MKNNIEDRMDNTESPRRFCMVVHAAYPLGETRVQREAEALIQNGFEVDVFCLRSEDEPLKDLHNQVRIYRLPLSRNLRRGFVAQFLEYLSFFVLVMFKLSVFHFKRHYQAIQVHNPPDFLVFVAWVPKLFGTKILLDIHDPMPELFIALTGCTSDSLMARLVRLQEAVACHFVDHVIVISDHWRCVLIERGVPPEKCSVVMNVADERIFHRPADRENEVTRLSRDGKFLMLYHGSVTERVGLDVAIHAVAQVCSEIPNVHLAIVGGGRAWEDLRSMVAELEIDEYISFEAGVPAEELPPLIMQADLEIVPYRRSVFIDYAVPTKLMECAAMGVPAIAARTPAIETYFSGTMVEFFESGDVEDLARCIHLLYNSPERMAELREGSKKFNEKYNWSKIGAEYVELVNRMLPGTVS